MVIIQVLSNSVPKEAEIAFSIPPEFPRLRRFFLDNEAASGCNSEESSLDGGVSMILLLLSPGKYRTSPLGIPKSISVIVVHGEVFPKSTFGVEIVYSKSRIPRTPLTPLVDKEHSTSAFAVQSADEC